MFNRIQGTKDVLPDEVCRWRRIEEVCRRVLEVYRYREIRLPLLEDVRLFSRSLGEGAEIVQKQMFLIRNQEETYALRPEGTASVVRAYLENNLDKTQGFCKLYYLGPMFRFEEPQKGMQRQFHHIGAEVISAVGPDIDAEVIALADALLAAVGISGHRILLNSLGCAEDKARLAVLLRQKLEAQRQRLCPDCQARFERSVLRILDCKNEGCRAIVESCVSHPEYLCAACQDHFDRCRGILDTLGVGYTVSAQLVRGLDYYTRTVFEITHPGLGAQDAIGAGGRYDGLVQELGGSARAAIGFALGMERLLLALPAEEPAPLRRTGVYLIALGAEAMKPGIALVQELRAEGIGADTDYQGRSLKAALRVANDSGSRFVILLGEDELKSGSVTLKDMQQGQQRQVPRDEVIKEIKHLC